MTVQALIEHHMRFLDKSSRGGNRTFVCAHCGNKYNGSQTRQLAHLLGQKGKGISVCNNIHEDARQELLAAVNRVNGSAAGPGSTTDASKETENAGGQSRKRLRQQELPCILKASSQPPPIDAQGGHVPASPAGNVPARPASPAGQITCRPDSQQAFQNCTVTAQQPSSEALQQHTSCENMAQRYTIGEEAWALPASAVARPTGRQSPQQCTPAEPGACEDRSQPRVAEGLPCSTAPCEQQEGAGTGHNSRDPRWQSPAGCPPSSAATSASTPPALAPTRTNGLTQSPNTNGFVAAAGMDAVGRGAQPCRVFDCGGPVADMSADAAALSGPVTGRQLAPTWQSQHSLVSTQHHHHHHQQQQQQRCDGGLAQQLAPKPAAQDTNLVVLQAQVRRLESENRVLAQKLSDERAAREEGRLRVAELSAELKAKDEHIKALLQVIKEGLVGQQQ
ncbi:hypothetical protein COCOBI_14-4540 [Coccomyxa sp. Obi]|nr:hypothetical protein COCOBI_14-4540 [Coccomyxa sp. Obi]